MTEVDYAMAWHFRFDGDPRNLQLRFRRKWAPAGSPTVFDGTGQLVAVVINYGGLDNGRTYPISDTGVSFESVEDAIEGWERWGWVSGAENQRIISLDLIAARLTAAGLAEGGRR